MCLGMKWFWVIGIIAIILFGIIIGVNIVDNEAIENEYNDFENVIDYKVNNIVILNSIEISNQEERTTPNTLMIYKTYYTKCKHYVQEYKDIDATLVNLTENELKEKCRKWNIDNFTSEEIEMSQEKVGFCGEHYKIKLENNIIVIYSIDENGEETEYDRTGITKEYLTDEDILKLTSGIYIYGKENLSSTLEDYE